MTDETVKWIEAVNRPHPPLFIDFLFLGSSRERIHKVTDIDADFPHLAKVGGRLFVAEGDSLACKTAFAKKVETRGWDFYSDYASMCYKNAEATLKRCKKLVKTHADGTTSTATALADFSQLMLDFAPFLLVTLSAQATLASPAQKMLEDAQVLLGPDWNIPRLRSLLIWPARKTDTELALEAESRLVQAVVEHNLDQANLWRVAAGEEAADDPSFWKLVDDYIEQFGWLNLNYFKGAIDTRQTVARRIVARLTAGRPPRAPHGEFEFAKLKESLDANSQRTLRTIREYSYLRTYRLLLFFKAHYIFHPIWTSLASTSGISTDDLIYLTHDEQLSLVDTSSPEDLHDVAIGRSTRPFTVIKRGNHLSWNDPEASTLAAPIAAPTSANDLEGETAVPGCARGIALVADQPGQAETARGGHVLVATMTTPAYGPAFYRVVAVVTDEGGLLCHAALLGREVGIPCVVGTQLATSILQSGDLVDIDATAQRATVRRIHWRKGVRRWSPTLWKYFSMWGQQSPRFAQSLDLRNASLNEAKSVDHQTYLASDAYQFLVDSFENRAEESAEYFEIVADRCYAACSELVATAQRINRELKGRPASAHELSELFDAYHEATLATIPFRYGILILDDILTKTTAQALVADLQVSFEEAESLITKLCPRPEPSFEAEYGRRIEELSEAYIEQNQDEGSSVDVHSVSNWLESTRHEYLAELLSEFSWLRTSYFTGDPISIDDVAQDVVKALRNTDDESKNELDASGITSLKRQLSSKSQYLLEQASRYIHLRSYRIAVCYKSDFIVRDLLKRVAVMIDVSYEQLVHMTGLEIAESLAARRLVVGHDELNQRISGYAIYMAAGDCWATAEVSTTDEARPAETEAIVSGRSAFSGAVTGPVAVVRGKHDLAKITPGVIVVSPMTTTDLTMTLEANAAGIVTDEGGTMSHAAIISRENRIPCVVGTDDATTHFRDGDIISIEAGSIEGVVRLIERPT